MSIGTGVGLVSGIDFEALIAGMSNASRGPIRIIQNRQAILNAKSEAYSAVTSQLTTLRDQLQGLLQPEDFNFRSSSSSSTSVLDVTSTDNAAEGSYAVRVLQLAQAERLGAQGVNSLDTAVGTDGGVLTIQVGENSTNVRSYNLSSSTTLAQLRDMINQDSDSGVTANVINDGSPTNAYRLVLTSKQTGADNTVTIVTNDSTLNFQDKLVEDPVAATGNQFDGTVSAQSDSYTGTGSLSIVLKTVTAGDLSGGAGAAEFVVSLDGGVTFGDTTYQADSSTPFEIPGAGGATISFAAGTLDLAVDDSFSIDVFDPQIAQAANAILTVDGIQISRSSNTFSDVVDGVTFTAKSVSSETVTASVSAQPGLLNAKLTEFRGAFNDTVELLKNASAYDAETNRAEPLFGDSAVRTVLNTLRRIATSQVDAADAEYNTLAALGMSLQTDGTLGFNQTEMNDALDNGLESIKKLFGQMGTSSSSDIQFVRANDATSARSFFVSITQAASRATVVGGQALQASGLGQDEVLTFEYEEEVFSVTLSAGVKIDTIVSALNDEFDNRGAAMEAVNQDGILRLQATSYGSDESFSVTSDRAGDSSAQLGIGTTQIDAIGADVAGTINGRAAQGSGQTLRGTASTSSEGLELRVTATAATSGTVDFSRGVADQMLTQLESYLDSETGVFATRQDGIGERIGDLNESITNMETRIERQAERYRRQFRAMESQLARYQQIGTYLSQSLSQLQNINA